MGTNYLNELNMVKADFDYSIFMSTQEMNRLRTILINPFIANRNHNLSQFVLLADQITVTGNEMSL